MCFQMFHIFWVGLACVLLRIARRKADLSIYGQNLNIWHLQDQRFMGCHNFLVIRVCGTFPINLSFFDLIFFYFWPAAISVPFLSLFI